VGLNASLAHTSALAGKLAFVSRSGALTTAVLDWSKSRGIGFSHFGSVGDRADVDFADLIDYLASDPGTRAILLPSGRQCVRCHRTQLQRVEHSGHGRTILRRN